MAEITPELARCRIPDSTHHRGCACHEESWRLRLETVEGERDELLDVMRAAMVLIAAKGRHNTFLAYEGIKAALDAHIPPSVSDNGV